MRRVHEDDLDFDQDDYLFYYKEEPFTGIYYENYPNGQVKFEQEYFQGEASGKYKAWHDNGEILAEGQVFRGDSVGLSREWDENGILIEEILKNAEGGNVYKKKGNNKGEIIFEEICKEPHYLRFLGERKWFYDSGRLKKRIVLEHGLEVLVQKWNEDGDLVFEERIDENHKDFQYLKEVRKEYQEWLAIPEAKRRKY